MGRTATLVLASVAACSSERVSPQHRDSTRVEHVIEKAMHERLGVPVRVRCVWLPPRCAVHVPDGSELGVAIVVERGALEWRLDGGLVLADDLEAYLRETLADMGAPQVARCGARIRAVAVGERIECGLQNGGRAFAVVNADSTTTIEIVLDPAVGAARSEVVRDDELLGISNKLDHDGEHGED